MKKKKGNYEGNNNINKYAYDKEKDKMEILSLEKEKVKNIDNKK